MRNTNPSSHQYNQYPSYFFAGFWMRFFAYIVDLIMIKSIGRIIIHPIFVIFRIPQVDSIFSAYSLAQMILFLSYFILMTKWTQGQTIGKMIFGLRVVSFTEEKLSWTTVMIREGFGRFILHKIPLLYLVLIFTERNQQVVDLLTDTSVITENMIQASRERLEEMIL
ncbi:MAG: RDD family protein [Bacteroidales bacterium]|nr:RDD family protein [Bacteroidales bacterium]